MRMSQCFRESFCSDNVLLRKLVKLAAELLIDRLEPRLELSAVSFADRRNAVFNPLHTCIEKVSELRHLYVVCLVDFRQLNFKLCGQRVRLRF